MKIKVSLYSLFALALILAVLAGCSRKPARTDAQIASDVQSKFYGDPMIESRQIQVQAAGGVVTLNGDVTSDTERVAAAGDAAAVDGVRTVVNNLQVQQALAVPSPALPPPSETKPSSRENGNKSAGHRHHRQDADESAVSVSNPVEARNTPPLDTPPAVQTPVPPPPP